MSIFRRITNLFHRSKLDQEIEAELRSHIEMRTADNIAAGMSLQKARRDALLRFGNRAVLKERVTAADAQLFLDSVWQDLCYGFRVLRKSPGFAAVALLTLALGIGANTAMFSALYGLVLQPLPYAGASRLVMLWDSNRKTGGTHIPVIEGSFPILRSEAKAFDGLAAFGPVNRSSELFAPKLWGTEERLAIGGVTPELFSVLGVAPLLGRTFTASEGVAILKGKGDQSQWESAHVAVLSYVYWRQHYGANPDVIGKTITLNRFGEKSQYIIVGVMPKGFDFPYPLYPAEPELWVNVAIPNTFVPGNNLQVVGRLKAGVNLAQAQAEINTIADRIRAQYPKYYKDEDVSVVPLSGELTRNVRSILWVLLAAFGFILLIGCANVGNLLLVRAVSREKEMAIRATLGASRLALIRQMLAEAMLLALAGGALGVLLAYGSLRVFLALLPQSIYIPRLDSVALDARMLVLAAGFSVIAAAVFSVLPSLRLARPNLNETLKSGNARKSPGHSVLRRPGSVLLVVEVSLALVLLTGALLMLRSMQKLLAVNGHFQPERLLSMTVDIDNAYLRPLQDLEPVRIHFQQFEQRVTALPGVETVALADWFPPVAHQHSSQQFKADGGGGAIAQGFEPADNHVVTPTYFDMMGMTLVRGRWFADSDTPGSLPVAVINEAMAKTYWRDSDPLGVKVQPWWRDTDKKISYEIVGIIREPKEFGTGETPLPAVYLDYAQVPLPYLSVIVRTRANPEGVASAMRNAALQIVPGHMFVGQVQTGDELISESSAQPRFTAQVLTAFSTLALLLAVVGIYGLISYYTSQRTHEIGIRMALGAQRGDVMGLVLREGMLLAGLGIAAGIAMSYWFGRTLSSLLYGVSPADPVTFIVVSILLTLVALVACYIPARRAMRVDPMVALRYE